MSLAPSQAIIEASTLLSQGAEAASLVFVLRPNSPLLHVHALVESLQGSFDL